MTYYIIAFPLTVFKLHLIFILMIIVCVYLIDYWNISTGIFKVISLEVTVIDVVLTSMILDKTTIQ